MQPLKSLRSTASLMCAPETIYAAANHCADPTARRTDRYAGNCYRITERERHERANCCAAGRFSSRDGRDARTREKNRQPCDQSDGRAPEYEPARFRYVLGGMDNIPLLGAFVSHCLPPDRLGFPNAFWRRAVVPRTCPSTLFTTLHNCALSGWAEYWMVANWLESNPSSSDA